VLSQHRVLLHLAVHLQMFLFALKKFDLRETFGQALKLIITLPGHLAVRVPRGNTGWATVSLTEQMEVPSDLKAFVEE
jgi:hypothetical protein